MLTLVAVIGVAISAVVFLYVGFSQHRRTRTLGDLIPIQRGFRAAVRSEAEFSTTTVATTISLATVVMAYFELASYMGAWLLWTVITTAAGLFVVRQVADRIRDRLRSYGTRIPTLHEFLATEFGARPLAVMGASATSLGYLGAFGVELSVGSRLFAGLVPDVPNWAVVVALASIGVAYTAAGGFRAVVITDRIQMGAIWLLIMVLGVFYAAVATQNGGIGASLAKLDPTVRNLSWRDGLGAFLLGILVINVPTYVADMGMWQRVTSLQNLASSRSALLRSTASAGVSWGLLAALAILAPIVITPVSGVNPLVTLLQSLPARHPWGSAVLLVSIIGLYAAMMSTASTELIVVSHTVHEDLLRGGRAGSSKMPPGRARLILVALGGVSVLVVEGLSRAGFTIADLVFAVYGAQLSLCPPVFAALFLPRDSLGRLRRAAFWAIGAGFLSGWASALAGKAIGSANLVFLAPVVSLLVSGTILGAGKLTKRPVS